MRSGRKLVFAASIALRLLLAGARGLRGRRSGKRFCARLDAPRPASTPPPPNSSSTPCRPIHLRQGRAEGHGLLQARRQGLPDGRAHPRSQRQAGPQGLLFSGGVFKLYEKLHRPGDHLTKAAKYRELSMLGFGASGKELEEKWDIKYLGRRRSTERQDRQAGTGGQGSRCPQEPPQSHHLAGHRARHQPQAGLRRGPGPIRGPATTSTSRSISPARRRLHFQDRQADPVRNQPSATPPSAKSMGKHSSV